ncbi:hypothetical protein [Arthrobacter sp. CG_A4]|nr:truncated hemoglobin YjbI [Arthrobacter sp. CG_A4]
MDDSQKQQNPPSLTAMWTAVDSLDLSPRYEATLWDYPDRAARSMVNSA